ncbi:MAG: sulfite exporter TauE/SafE family protein, partial [Fluviibacter sp.]
METLLISFASFFAGMIDSIVGGGGLILVPALFATYPTASPATLLGTNKCASVWGTSLATYQYSKRVQLAWCALLPAALFALAGSFAGAWSATQIDPGFIRKLMPFILLVVLIYTLVKKDMGATHKPHHNKNHERIIACLIGA